LDDRHSDPDHHSPGVGLAMTSSAQSAPGRTVGDGVESAVSAVSWPAIVAGGLTAVAATLILLMVGAGLGFSSVSPWAGQGASATSLAVGTVIWLIVVQWLSSGVGGYVAGRLRTSWTGVDRDEVFFRDTVHGLLAWALATMIGVALLSSAVGTIIGAGARGVGAASEGALQTAAATIGPMSQYDLDALMRPAQVGDASRDTTATDVAPEVLRIITNGLSAGDVPAAERAYLAQIVAARAGISQEDARQRVDQTIERARQAAVQAREVAETARKTAAKVALFGALAMLIGAFVASAAAAFGGRLRDEPS
jgi:hypothetical protein